MINLVIVLFPLSDQQGIKMKIEPILKIVLYPIFWVSGNISNLILQRTDE